MVMTFVKRNIGRGEATLLCAVLKTSTDGVWAAWLFEREIAALDDGSRCGSVPGAELVNTTRLESTIGVHELLVEKDEG